MLWNAAKSYSNRKRTEGKTTEQENKEEEEKEIRIRDCIEVSSAAWLNYFTLTTNESVYS